MSFTTQSGPPPQPPKNARWFLFQENRVLIIQEGDEARIPGTDDVRNAISLPAEEKFFGVLNDQPCYAAELSSNAVLPEPFTRMGLRHVFRHFDSDGIQAAGLAGHLLAWRRNHRFCGKCGSLTRDKEEERAIVCPECGLVNYPRLSPAIIVAVIRDGKILLGHSTRFPEAYYSVLAGFVEPGETVEECVEREVYEEVKISLKNIRYFGSQPWPFPDSLMLGFTAEHAGGEIQVDGLELDHADWFLPSELPGIPPRVSISRELIDWFAKSSDSEI